jgi:hypothetical protein
MYLTRRSQKPYPAPCGLITTTHMWRLPPHMCWLVRQHGPPSSSCGAADTITAGWAHTTVTPDGSTGDFKTPEAHRTATLVQAQPGPANRGLQLSTEPQPHTTVKPDSATVVLTPPLLATPYSCTGAYPTWPDWYGTAAVNRATACTHWNYTIVAARQLTLTSSENMSSVTPCGHRCWPAP